MSAQITLPPEVAARLRAEADRRGVSADACAAELLDRTLPPADARAAAAAEFDRWAAAAESMSDEEAASNAEVLRAIDEDRPAGRKLFAHLLTGGEG